MMQARLQPSADHISSLSDKLMLRRSVEHSFSYGQIISQAKLTKLHSPNLCEILDSKQIHSSFCTLFGVGVGVGCQVAVVEIPALLI